MNGAATECQDIPAVTKFQARVKAFPKSGKMTCAKDKLTITGADSVMFMISIATSYNNCRDAGGDPEARARKFMADASGADYETLVRAHVAERQHPFKASVCGGPTMDMQIIRDLFNNCIAASEIIGTDCGFRKQCGKTRDRLAPMQIGAQLQLQEWLEDWDTKAP